jgi:hypothetical protein
VISAATRVEREITIDLPPLAINPAASAVASAASAAAAEPGTASAGADGAPVSETLRTFWKANQWAYDNIGVSKPPTATARYRYLTCADCDKGPLGVCFPADEPEQLYLCADRVKYTPVQ